MPVFNKYIRDFHICKVRSRRSVIVSEVDNLAIKKSLGLNAVHVLNGLERGQ